MNDEGSDAYTTYMPCNDCISLEEFDSIMDNIKEKEKYILHTMFFEK